MSTVKRSWHTYLFIPVFIVLLTAVAAPATPVFDALPSAFGAAGRALALATGMAGILLKDGNDRLLRKIILPVLSAASLVFLLETGKTLPLDAVLIILLLSGTDLMTSALTSFSFFSCMTGATAICSLKGFVRTYKFGAVSTLGFRSSTGLFVSVTAAAVSAAAVIILFNKDRKIRPAFIRFILAAALSASVVAAALKVQNLSAAVEAGRYEIYAGDTVMALEVRMKGFDDYSIGFGKDEATVFSITPDGDDYRITMDSYGVTKTLCVIEGGLYAGNYDQSEAHHTWSIDEVAGTPYFTVRNVGTGLVLSMEEDGSVCLVQTPDESSYMRIGSENLERFGRMSDEAEDDGYDLSVSIEGMDAVEPQTYTGGALTPEVEVRVGQTILTEGVDYELTYWNNYLPGRAWIDITGVGDYRGTYGVSFDIIFDDISMDDPFYQDTSGYVIRVFRMTDLRYPTHEEAEALFVSLVASNLTPDSVVLDRYWEGRFDGLTDAQFMEAVYRLMLLRNGSREELSLWIGELHSGTSRIDVIYNIVESPDYQNIWHDFGIGYR